MKQPYDSHIRLEIHPIISFLLSTSLLGWAMLGFFFFYPCMCFFRDCVAQCLVWFWEFGRLGSPRNPRPFIFFFILDEKSPKNVTSPLLHGVIKHCDASSPTTWHLYSFPPIFFCVSTLLQSLSTLFFSFLRSLLHVSPLSVISAHVSPSPLPALSMVTNSLLLFRSTNYLPSHHLSSVWLWFWCRLKNLMIKINQRSDAVMSSVQSPLSSSALFPAHPQSMSDLGFIWVLLDLGFCS